MPASGYGAPVDGAQDSGNPTGSTARLALRVPAESDAEELLRMYGDPRLWQDDPVLRLGTLEEARTRIERWVAAWQRDGHGYWVLRSSFAATAGQLVGVGGCSLRSTAGWNLAFSLRPEFWGQGYAQEVALAGMSAARNLRADLPVTALAAAGNRRSQRAIERAGLHLVWRGPDARSQDPTAELLLYTDRPLTPSQVQTVTA